MVLKSIEVFTLSSRLGENGIEIVVAWLGWGDAMAGVGVRYRTVKLSGEVEEDGDEDGEDGGSSQ